MRYEFLNITDDELRKMGLVISSREYNCFMCGNTTNYIDYCTEVGICSEECMVKQNKILS